MQNDDIKKCAKWMILSSLSFSLMALMIKLSSKTIPEALIIFFRASVMLFLVSILLRSEHESIKNTQLKSLFLRSLAGSISIYFYTHSIAKLPLSIAILLACTAPLFVVLISFIVLKESITKKIFFSMLLSLFGILLITNPFQTTTTLNHAGIFFGLMSAFFAGIAYTTLRALSGKISSTVIVFYFALIASLFSLPEAIHDFSLSLFTPKSLLFLISIGFFGFFGQIFMTKGYQYAKASTASSFGLVSVLFSTSWGFLFLNETITIERLIGMFFVMSGVFLISRFQNTA